MKIEEFEKWKENNATSYTEEWINGIRYGFATLTDGWVGVVELKPDRVIPIISADTIAHARDYVWRIEPITVQFNIL